MDPFEGLYSRIAERKGERYAVDRYGGGNGRIDKAVDLIRNDPAFPKSGTLLDIGGATGNLGYALRDLFQRRIVADICLECCAPAESKGNKFIAGNVDFHGISLDDCTVDLITALDVIEHVIDPQKLSGECLRVLRPGGMVLLNTPNIQFWRHLQSLVCEGVFPHTSGDREVYHGGHVAFFTYDDMEKIFCQFVDRRQHLLPPMEPCPPVWLQLLSDKRNATARLCYPDLVFSCRKP